MVHSIFREVRCDHGKVRCLVHSNFMDRCVVYSTYGEARVGHGENCVGHVEVRVVVHSNFEDSLRSIPPLLRFGVVMFRFEVWSIPPLGRFDVVMVRFEVWSIPL